jgi:hypothetical protein
VKQITQHSTSRASQSEHLKSFQVRPADLERPELAPELTLDSDWAWHHQLAHGSLQPHRWCRVLKVTASRVEPDATHFLEDSSTHSEALLCSTGVNLDAQLQDHVQDHGLVLLTDTDLAQLDVHDSDRPSWTCVNACCTREHLRQVLPLNSITTIMKLITQLVKKTRASFRDVSSRCCECWHAHRWNEQPS